jgi:hypothetical protein
MIRVNQQILNGDTLDPKLTKLGIGISSNKNHLLDATFYKTTTFYTSTVHRNLQVLEKRIKQTRIFRIPRATCRSCFETIEDQDHIWKCRNSINLYQDILAEAKLFIAPKLMKIGITLNLNQMLHILDMSDSYFLTLPLSRGLVTKSSINAINGIFGKAEKILPIVAAGFMSALYQKIWRPRTYIIQKENDRLLRLEETARKKLEKEKRKGY